jgi:hypothetical protein
MKGVFHWFVRWALNAGTKYFCPALAALAGPKQNIFFLTAHYLISLVTPNSKEV